jgi:tetratricopeptide (TPR) repeat protein
MRFVLIGCALLIATAPAQAALNVLGPTMARECYEAAQSNSGNGAAVCDRALGNEQITARDKAATLVNRGIIYNDGRRLDLAIADFNAAIGIDPDLGEAYLNRGNAYFFRREFSEALSDYSKAIDLKIGNLDYAYYDRALVYEMMNRLDEAKSDLQSALGLSPHFKAASDRLSAIAQLLQARAGAPVQAAPEAPTQSEPEPTAPPQ